MLCIAGNVTSNLTKPPSLRRFSTPLQGKREPDPTFPRLGLKNGADGPLA
ncbi:hypothetical protein FHS64_000692 [Brevundimonas terrae]|jgi:hypothetical protein|nr:hypothetical protein [Brevundimonas terrae]